MNKIELFSFVFMFGIAFLLAVYHIGLDLIRAIDAAQASGEQHGKRNNRMSDKANHVCEDDYIYLHISNHIGRNNKSNAHHYRNCQHRRKRGHKVLKSEKAGNGCCATAVKQEDSDIEAECA